MMPMRPEVVVQLPRRTWSQKRSVLKPSTRWNEPERISAIMRELVPPTWNIGRFTRIPSPSRR